jgi:tetratricopeptide (TPR) repeat protein
MSLDPYASCPCGSGKKFKWCCQPIYSGIQQAWAQENNNQHDAALRTMEEVVRQHPGNPEAWGQKASLLFANNRLEEGEAALEKAFAINPNYPAGLRLRARLRLAEGEIHGALLLARRAAEHYAPEAREALSEIHALIFDCELRCNRPVAARAALEQCQRCDPTNEQINQLFTSIFGPESRYPQAAIRAYNFRKPQGGANGSRWAAWDTALAEVGPSLSKMAAAFETLTQQDPADAAAWFNLGLCQAWLGNNAAALQSLDRSIELDSDEVSAVEAATLAEVLRLGAGLEDSCDYHDYICTTRLTNPEPVQALLNEWVEQRRLIALPNNQEGVLTAMLLEHSQTGLITVGRPATEVARLAGYLLIAGGVLRLSSPVREPLNRLREEVRERLQLPLTALQIHEAPANFPDIIAEAIFMPTVEGETASHKAIELAGEFFENTWIHRPRRSLNNITPVDAAAHPRLRRKLLGIIQLLEETARRGLLAGYDFNRLRRKLGLLDIPTPGAGPLNISAMGAAELAALDRAALSQEQLEKAYQTAYRLDAQELAEAFATALISRPAQSDKTDRYPWYAFLVHKALRDGNPEAALQQLSAGEQFDLEFNHGARSIDYGLLRARTLGQRGEPEAAAGIYQRLIEQSPRDLKIRGKAAEHMLSLKQPARAVQFAEEGLTVARQANDRDSENFLMELLDAARRQLG